MTLKCFLEEYAKSGISRFHMPGHKGCFPPLSELGDLTPYDITEIGGADYLFQSTGLLKELEERVARFYGSAGTAISTGGSTLCIQGMLAAGFSKGDRILAGRNAHVAFVNACALLGLEPIWILPQVSEGVGISEIITPEQIVETIEKSPEAKGVYLTSPDYLGGLCDLSSIAEICHQKGLLLVVDNAHGAALPLASPKLHPIAMGADLCCDSAHKTLPVLTGGAFLHYSEPFTAAQIKAKMALFGSTSPSYLTMLSIELCMDWLEKEGRAAYRGTARQIEKMKSLCDNKKVPYFAQPKVDPFRLTIYTGMLGLTDRNAGEYFRQNQIEPEYIGGGAVVLLATPFNPPRDWERLKKTIIALGAFPKQKPASLPPISLPEVAMPPAQAVFSKSQRLPLKEAVGRIAAQTVITCPPGIPIVVPGERISPQIATILEYSGNETVAVLK